MIQTSEIKSFECLVQARNLIVGGMTGPQRWWRGHGNVDWKLQPVLYRDPRYSKKEDWFIEQFKTHAPVRMGHACPDPKDIGGWLSLMRHFGIPVRLLDWSLSPFTALYFAVADTSEAANNKDAALWAINPTGLNYVEQQCSWVAFAEENQPQQAMPANIDTSSEYSKLRADNDEIKASVSAFRIPDKSLRAIAQASAYTYHANNSPIEELQNSGDYLRKFIIPASKKEELKRELEAIGVDAIRLSPDVESLVKYILNSVT